MRRRELLRAAKKGLAISLAAVTVSVSALGGLTFVQEPVEVQAAGTSDVLSGKDRNVIFANTRTDFRDESIYFVVVTRYYNGDESNDVQCWDGTQYNLNDPAWRGDFKGLIEKLDYIKALGFTAIWITPVVENCSGYDYHGYHAKDFTEVDERYESDDCTYQDLIDAVHAKGMKIIQDVVYNHTGNFGEDNLMPLFEKVGDLSTPDCLQLADGVDLPANYFDLPPGMQYDMRLALMKNTDGVNHDVNNIYHHFGHFNWDDYSCQLGQIAGDCVDLNTENPIVYNYLVDAYTNYINMGVDGFRVDTVRHISRLTLNKVFNQAFIKAGKENGKDFFMFGEVCTRDNGNVWYRQSPSMSTPFYTWKESKDYAWSDTDWEVNYESAMQCTLDNFDASTIANQPTSDNAFLSGNDYHETDYSQFSGLNVIDFPMHWSFKTAQNAFGVALRGDKYYNDATWNVTYVDSHDYAPDGAPESERFNQDQSVWAENLSLLFTFRGIPCIYYGSETEFKKGSLIDKGPTLPLEDTGRAYYGDNIEGTITAVDFGEYGNVSGAVADTLMHPLSQHIQRLNRIRQAVPALRKGQYSTEGVSGELAFKRRYTDDTTDSFVCVSISGNATFTGIPNGRYVDAVTGDVQNVTNGTLSISVSGKGNLKAYVLDTAKTPAPGRVVTNGKYLTDGGAIKDIGPIEIEVVEETGVTLSDKAVTVLEGESVKVSATVTPSDATYKTVKWTSSDETVATVAGGRITGVTPGTATITATTQNGLTATVKVTVKVNTNIVKPDGITLSDKEVTITVNNTASVTATVTPSNATDKTVTWTSSDETVAKVNRAGTITAVAEGTAVITATTFNGYKATVKVTVKAREIQVIENGIYFEKPSGWGDTIYAYAWTEKNGTTAHLGAWPGTMMQELEDGLYGLSFKYDESNTMIIFNDGSGHQTADLEFKNSGFYNASGLVQIVDPSEEKGKVIVEYVDMAGNILSIKTLSGKVGSAYTTEAIDIDGYELFQSPANASGTYTKDDITVSYIYAIKNVVPEIMSKLSVSDTDIKVGDTITLTASASGGLGKYTYNFYCKKGTGADYYLAENTPDNIYKWTPSEAGTYYLHVMAMDGVTLVSNISQTITVTVTKEDSSSTPHGLKISAKVDDADVTVGDSVTLTATATGGSGAYKYSYIVYNETADKWSRIKDKITDNTYIWTAKSAGTRVFYIEVTDGTGKTVRSEGITVTTTKSSGISVTLKASSTNVVVGDEVKLTATATGGNGTYKYSYIVYNETTDKWSRIKDKIAANEYTWTAKSAGTRKFYVDVTDSTGKTVRTSAVTVKTTNNETSGTSLSVTANASDTSVTVNDKVTFTATAKGGSGSYKYSYIVYNKTTDKWSRIVDKSSSNTYTWTAKSAGIREFYVDVTDASGKTVRCSAITVETNKGNSLEIIGSATKTSLTVGQSTSIIGTVLTGASPYTYSFVVYNESTGKWYRYDFGTSNILSWEAKSKGTRVFYVEVKDKTGEIVRSKGVKVVVK